MSEEEIKGLAYLIQEYREALRSTLPLAKEVVEEEIGNLMNQCTEAIKLLENPNRENLERVKKIIASIMLRFEEIYQEIVEENNQNEEEDLTFLSDFLYYSRSYSPS